MENVISHVNYVLSKIGEIKDINEIEFFLSVEELKLTNDNWSNAEELERAVKEIHKKGLILNYDSLNKEYQQEISRKVHHFLIAVDYPIDGNIRIDNVEIEIIETTDEILKLIQDNADASPFWESTIQLLNLKKLKLLRFSFYNKTFAIAHRCFESNHLLLRGIIEYSFNRWPWSWGHSPTNRQCATFQYPKFIFIYADDFNKIVYTQKSNHSKALPHLIHGYRKQCEEYFEYFKSKDNKSMYKYYADFFRLYSLGNDTNTNREAFLLYWNVLEKLIQPIKQNGNTKAILNRASIFQFHSINNYKNILKQLGRIRNDLVHRGIDNVDELYIGYLKLIIHNCFDYFFDNKEILNSQEQLDTFLAFVDIPYADMQTNFKLLKKLLDN